MRSLVAKARRTWLEWQRTTKRRRWAIEESRLSGPARSRRSAVRKTRSERAWFLKTAEQARRDPVTCTSPPFLAYIVGTRALRFAPFDSPREGDFRGGDEKPRAPRSERPRQQTAAPRALVTLQ